MADLENQYSQWNNGKVIDLDPDVLRKFRLRKAIDEGHLAMVKINLRDPNEIIDGYFGRSCLFYACMERRKPEIIKLLLDYGADPNLVTTTVIFNGTVVKSESPLYRALSRNLSICELLISYGADINLRMDGGTALIKYLRKWKASRFMELKFLIQNGADIDICDQDGMTGRKLLERYGFRDVVQYYDEHQIDVKCALDD